MRSILKDVEMIIGNQIRLLQLPILLALLDGILNMGFYSVMILAIIRLVEQQFTTAFFYQGLITLLIVFVLRVILSRYSYNSMQINGSKVITELRIRLADHVRSLNSGYFNQNSIGKLTSHFTTDIADFEQILTHYTTDFVKAVFTIGIGLIASLIIDFRFAILIVLLIAVALPLLLQGGNTGARVSGGHREKINQVISRVVEYINGIKTFRLYHLTGAKFQRLDQSFHELRKSAIKLELSMMPYVMAFATIVSFIIPAALLWGTHLLIGQAIDIQRFIAVLMLSVSISSQLVAVGMMYPEIKYMSRAASNLKEVFAQQPLSYQQDTLSAANYQVEFSDVYFAYENDVSVLKGISFSAKPGTTTALIGPSGSGKSTIIHLLSRFWDVKAGKITIGGTDISLVRPDGLTEHISCVFQDVYLFHDTIINNIKIAKPEASFEEVVTACRQANCHTFISALEAGYETMVGEGGSSLSGGEKQRISIARAILKDAPIVLLDETTSSLDADNELEINAALDQLMAEKTVIVIAHRLNTIVNATQIIVLDDGEIREQGHHHSLLGNNDWYAQMYREQEKARNWIVS